METALEVKGLTKRYGNVIAVRDFNLCVKKGEIFGLLGPNGVGKSTTIECILGTKKADSGHVQILGMDPIKDRKRLFQQVGVQFQQSHYPDRELCQVTEVLYQQISDHHSLLDIFGLKQLAKAQFTDLSGGEKQRLSVLLALIPQPKLVFFDEITTGLDPKGRRDVWQLLENLKQNGLTILLTSHFMDEVEALCDKIGILHQGKTITMGTIAQVIAGSPLDSLKETYLWYTKKEESVYETA